MKKLFGKTTLVLLLAAAIASSAAAQAPVLNGHWTSAAPEAQGQLFAARDFAFDGNTWSVTYRAFADAQGKMPLFTLNVGGVFVLGGPSPTVSGAYEGVFPALRREIVAESEAGVAMFAGMGCKLEVGAPKVLLAEPCGFVPSQMQAMGEYDLVMLKNGQLFFGDRSGDLTKARPTALTPYPLVRK